MTAVSGEDPMTPTFPLRKYQQSTNLINHGGLWQTAAADLVRKATVVLRGPHSTTHEEQQRGCRLYVGVSLRQSISSSSLHWASFVFS